MKAVSRYSSGNVRVDPALGSVHLFRTLKTFKKDTPRERLDVELVWGEVKLRFHGDSALDIGDQSVLLAVIEVGQTHLKACQREACEAGKQCISEWIGEQTFDPEADQVLVRTSFGQLARISRPSVGYGGASLEAVRQSLKRLAQTTVWQKHGEIERASQLLAWRISDGKLVELVLNSRLVQALLGNRYRPVNMDERAQVDGDLAKHIHFMWSCRVSPGKHYSVNVDTLRLHVYGEVASNGAEYTAATIRQQRKRVLDAVRSIAALDQWYVRHQGHRIDVTRRARKKDSSSLERRVQIFQSTATCVPEGEVNSLPGATA
ncbi:replication protein C, IncQ-type [Pulveribacter sp.]|uniref:replication protein C, IncQ-type n=1 Tax=Pulveribacter sp. TaxID=2678893 RepID=UPI0028AB52CE|nr:replication protein C, IncQ-type [Pulveribacter sp.]